MNENDKTRTYLQWAGKIAVKADNVRTSLLQFVTDTCLNRYTRTDRPNVHNATDGNNTFFLNFLAYIIYIRNDSVNFVKNKALVIKILHMHK